MTCIGLDRKSFKNVIFNTIQKTGKTYRELADELGITHSTFTRIKQEKLINLDAFIILMIWLEVENHSIYNLVLYK